MNQWLRIIAWHLWNLWPGFYNLYNKPKTFKILSPPLIHTPMIMSRLRPFILPRPLYFPKPKNYNIKEFKI
jgi:hypothetical protein